MKAEISRMLASEGAVTGGEPMRIGQLRIAVLASLLLVCVTGAALAQNRITGEIKFAGATNVEKSSGVWIDGQYVGYLKELKGNKHVALLPGRHEISVRQSGYSDITRNVIVEPGQTQVFHVAMQKAEGATWPTTTATLKIDVKPERAAVFVDDEYAGHAGEFGGAFDSMRLSPGRHRIKVALPGYQTFETEVNLLADQKAEVKTELAKGSIEQAGPLLVVQADQPRAEAKR
jgi:hypothetical protein